MKQSIGGATFLHKQWTSRDICFKVKLCESYYQPRSSVFKANLIKFSLFFSQLGTVFYGTWKKVQNRTRSSGW